MSIFLDQIEKRKRLEEATLVETFEKGARRLGIEGKKKHAIPPTDHTAVRRVLDALGVTGYELSDDGMTTPFEQLSAILSPKGIMMRKVRLKDNWWKNSVGPMLGYDKEGNVTALIPTRWGFGYTFIDKDGNIQKVNKKAMNSALSRHAVAFCMPLPNRELTIADLMKYAAKAMSVPNALLLFATALVLALFGMFTPMANKMIFDMVIPTGEARDLLPIFGLLAGAGIGTMLFSLTRNLCTERIRRVVEMQVQNAIMARTFFLSPNFFTKISSGELAMRINNVWNVCNHINDTLVGALLTLLFSTVYLVQVFIYAKSLLVPTLLIIAVELTALAIYYHSIVKAQEEYTEKSGKLSGIEYGMLAGIQKLKLTGSERRAQTLWLDKYTDATKSIYNPTLDRILMPALLQLCNVGGLGVIFYFIMANGVTTSDYIAFSSAYGMISAAITTLISIIPEIAQLKPQINSLKPILEEKPEMEQNAPQVDELFGSIEMTDVSFRYANDGPMVLEDINLSIAPGEYVGIVGKSGCGKSTLMRLLLGFEKPIKGSIYYDNHDLSKVDKTSLRRKIGCCLQNGSLFTGDLFHNITITAPWATHEDAWEALRMADMEKDVKRMPMGLHTVVVEGSAGFSGGQKQRLLIARALIGHPQIIFFDEATSALDNISQKQVSDNLDSLNCTRLVIAHRLSTIRHCDRIIVLDKGRIAEEGNFDELMAKKGLFYEMSLRQM